MNQPINVLVLADRYPPDVYGGAELSLSLTLSKLATQEDILITVAALSENDPSVRHDEHQGIPVCRIPFNGQWPPVSIATTSIVRQKRPARLAKLLDQAFTIGRYLWSDGATPFRDRTRALRLAQRLRSTGLGAWFPMMDADFSTMSPASASLVKLVDNLKPDIIHADNFRSIRLACNLPRRDWKLIVHIRDNRFLCTRRSGQANIDGVACSSCSFSCLEPLDLRNKREVGRFMEMDKGKRRQYLSRADKVIVTSEYLLSQIEDLGTSTPVEIVANPSDQIEVVDRYQRGIARAQPPEILIVGMINENKGQVRVPDWIDALRKEVSDFRFVLAGRGDLSEIINARTADRGNADHLLLAGFLSREELYRCYARASIVLAPNVWPEPFGRVPLEAGLSRRPIIAYALGGIKENIINGETGIHVEPNDEDQLLQSVVYLLKNPDVAVRMGERARLHVVKTFQLDRTAKRLGGIWRDAARMVDNV